MLFYECIVVILQNVIQFEILKFRTTTLIKVTVEVNYVMTCTMAYLIQCTKQNLNEILKYLHDTFV